MPAPMPRSRPGNRRTSSNGAAATGLWSTLAGRGYVIVQSPYACAVNSLHAALGAGYTGVVEETEAIARLGGRVVAIAGDPWCHHIVEPRDLVNAARLLEIDPP